MYYYRSNLKLFFLAFLFLISPSPYHSIVSYFKFCINIICIAAVTTLSSLTDTHRKKQSLPGRPYRVKILKGQTTRKKTCSHWRDGDIFVSLKCSSLERVPSRSCPGWGWDQSSWSHSRSKLGALAALSQQRALQWLGKFRLTAESVFWAELPLNKCFLPSLDL